MKKNVKILIVFFILILLCAGLLVLFQWLKQVPANPSDTVGNTAGNLYNGGLFCESDGKIYFSNAYDNNKLYSMNSDETNLTKLNDSVTGYINSGGKYLYYYQSEAAADQGNVGLGFVRRVSGIYRIQKSGKKNTGLSRCVCNAVLLYGNSLYYQYFDPEKGLSLRTMDINGNEETTLFEGIYYPVNVQDGVLYFADVENEQILCSYNIETEEFAEFFKYRVWNPVSFGDYIYFMDIIDNYRLCRYSLIDGSVTTLTSDRVDCFNLNDTYIVYQSSSKKAPALKRITLDGGSPETIMEGNYTAIHMTSEYVYFRAFDNELPIYRTPAHGEIDVSEFDAAKLAALRQLEKK